jgi:hypothetical protein
MRKTTNYYKIFFEKPKGNVPFRVSSRSGEYNIKVYFKEIGYESVEWIHVAHAADQFGAVAKTLMNPRVPLQMGSLLTSLATTGFSRTALFHGVKRFLKHFTTCFKITRMGKVKIHRKF